MKMGSKRKEGVQDSFRPNEQRLVQYVNLMILTFMIFNIETHAKNWGSESTNNVNFQTLTADYVRKWCVDVLVFKFKNKANKLNQNKLFA